MVLATCSLVSSVVIVAVAAPDADDLREVTQA